MGEDPTVAALHRTLVMLRRELEAKTRRIVEMEAGIRANTAVDQNFNDIFELVEVLESTEEGVSRTSSTSEWDTIRNDTVEPPPETPTEDPIMAFVLSDEEDQQDHKCHRDPSHSEAVRNSPHLEKNLSGRRISLRINEDIQIHDPPTQLRPASADNHEPERPIWRAHNSALAQPLRAESAIQTDITAVRDRPWSSDPVLVKSSARVVSMPGTVLKRSHDYRGKGRYSLLNRDFSPKPLQVDSLNHSSLPRHQIHVRHLEPEVVPRFQRFDEDLSSCIEDCSRIIGSTEELLFIAQEFVTTARYKRVQLQDWKVIRESYPKALRRNDDLDSSKVLPIVAPFIPQNMNQLILGYKVRFIYNNQLVNGTIRSVDRGASGRSHSRGQNHLDWVGIESHEIAQQSTFEHSALRKARFSCLAGGVGILVPFEKIIICSKPG